MNAKNAVLDLARLFLPENKFKLSCILKNKC